MNLELLKNVGRVQNRSSKQGESSLVIISEKDMARLEEMETRLGILVNTLQRNVYNTQQDMLRIISMHEKRLTGLLDTKDEEVKKFSSSRKNIEEKTVSHEQKIGELRSYIEDSKKELSALLSGTNKNIKELEGKHDRSFSSAIEKASEYKKDVGELQSYISRIEKGGLVMRDELKKKFEEDMQAVRKGVAEMGYSLLLLTDGKTVGTVPALNLAAGTGVTLASAFVNGIPKVTITAPSTAPTFYNDTVSGTIDGTNKVFTVPNTIVSALFLSLGNASYQAGVDYTVTGAKQITMTVAPDATLSGQPFWLSHT